MRIGSAKAIAWMESGYLSVILSIILGLSMTQLLQGLSQVIICARIISGTPAGFSARS